MADRPVDASRQLMKHRFYLPLGLCLVAVGMPGTRTGTQAPGAQSPTVAVATGGLAPTAHTPLPARASEMWLIPDPGDVDRSRNTTVALKDFATGVDLAARGKYQEAMPLVSAGELRSTELAGYSTYYTGLVQLRLGRADEARRTFASLDVNKVQGYLSEAGSLAEGEAAEAQRQHGAAAQIYARLSRQKTMAPDEILFRLGRAAAGAGNREQAAAAFRRVYYEYPLSDLAKSANDELGRLRDVKISARERVGLLLTRGRLLFEARRYADAKAAYGSAASLAQGDEREAAAIGIAECDYYLRRYQSARNALRTRLDSPTRSAEVRFFYLSAIRALGARDQAAAMTDKLVAEFPGNRWAEEALNSLASSYVRADDDEKSIAVFRKLLDKFPSGNYAERAAWKVGWWAYRKADYVEATRVFDAATARFPRSDYRPPYIYWAGRAYERLGHAGLAKARYDLAATDYLNSYYGRLAARQLRKLGAPLPSASVASGSSAGIGATGGNGYGESTVSAAANAEDRPLPTETLIRALLSLGLYDAALDELRYAQSVWGNTPALEATVAWAHNRKGELRRAITSMRRAYPQYMASGGERLPAEVLRVIFPLDYWNLIRQYATLHNLDPYLLAALINQESTFSADVRSSANAYGLMQLLPSTGRRVARSIGLRRFTTATLKIPETNIRLGTAYFASLLKRFGETHLALAGYNAGEHRVVRWLAEKPGLGEEEFIDDIPFPETQNYVKRILGTADDYRRLYGEMGALPAAHAVVESSSASAAIKTPAP